MGLCNRIGWMHLGCRSAIAVALMLAADHGAAQHSILALCGWCQPHAAVSLSFLSFTCLVTARAWTARTAARLVGSFIAPAVTSLQTLFRFPSSFPRAWTARTAARRRAWAR